MLDKKPWFLRARLKTRQLLLLIAIEEEGNIHRAAETLHMSQPAASKLLKDLEDMIEVQLFERLPRGMRPTWYGEIMIRHARVALASLNEAGHEIQAMKSGHHGHVHIGCIQGPAVTLIPEVINRVITDHPQLCISLTVETSDILLERLIQSRLDITVSRLFAHHDKTHLHYQALAEEEICAVVRPKHPILKQNGLTLSNLQDCGWVVPPSESILRHRFDLMFQSEGLVPPSKLVESTAVVFIIRMLLQSDYLSLLPTDVAHYYASRDVVAVVPIDLSCNMDAFGVIVRTDWLLSPAAKIVYETLLDTSRDIYNAFPKKGRHGPQAP